MQQEAPIAEISATRYLRIREPGLSCMSGAQRCQSRPAQPTTADLQPLHIKQRGHFTTSRTGAIFPPRPSSSMERQQGNRKDGSLAAPEDRA